MKNKELWQPTKYVYRQNKLIASRSSSQVTISSRLMADLVAFHYDSNLKKYARGRLIDLGCGKAPLYGAYKDLVTDTVCVDWSDASGKNIHLDYECDLNKPLPFDNSAFDTVILSDVLEHIQNPFLLWEEISRIMIEQGKIIMNVPFFYHIHEAPYDYFRYTEFALRNFAELSGFKIILIQPIGGAPEIVADIFAKNVLRVPLLGAFFSTAVQKTCALFLKTSLGKKISKKTSKKFPYGYFMVAEKK
ncbi:MAG: methyltransferase domain-containing protein [Bacteroidetes bacterium]|nr:methyltransferase domain-containing protein [Bacteroidota bacterium]MBI3481939.1 methyltransferase domain-containing protein [Bacteroidota bacterium]